MTTGKATTTVTQRILRMTLVYDRSYDLFEGGGKARLWVRWPDSVLEYMCFGTIHVDNYVGDGLNGSGRCIIRGTAVRVMKTQSFPLSSQWPLIPVSHDDQPCSRLMTVRESIPR